MSARIFVGLVAMCGVLGCADGGSGGADSGVGAAVAVDCSRNPPLNWTNFADGFFAKNCDGCHSSALIGEERRDAPEGVDFDTEDGASQWAASVRQQVLEADAMPPGAGLTDEERSMLDEWLTCAMGL